MSLVNEKLNEAFDKLYEFYGDVNPVDEKANSLRADHIGRLLASKYRKNGPDKVNTKGNLTTYTIGIQGVEPISNSVINPMKLTGIMRLMYVMSGGVPGETNLNGEPDTWHDEPGTDSDLELVEVYIILTTDKGETFAEVEVGSDDWDSVIPNTMAELSENNNNGDGMMVNGQPMSVNKPDLTNIAGE